jgi:hypothetical protein
MPKLADRADSRGKRTARKPQKAPNAGQPGNCRPELPSGFAKLGVSQLLTVHFYRGSNLLKRASARGEHVASRVAQKNKTLLIGVAFKGPLLRRQSAGTVQSKNCGNLRLLLGW